MAQERIHKPSSWHPPTQVKSALFAPRPAIQTQPDSDELLNQEETKGRAVKQNEFGGGFDRSFATIPAHAPGNHSFASAESQFPIQRSTIPSYRASVLPQSTQQAIDSAQNGKMGWVQRSIPATNPLSYSIAPIQTQPVQLIREATHNQTGLPNTLKVGVENLSGYALDDVRVHYNSPKPAQLQALAYTQGTDIHVAPGQEQHLPHEAWHVVQQKQGRVKPTLQMQGVQINDKTSLEQEANVMGEKSLKGIQNNLVPVKPVEEAVLNLSHSTTIQMVEPATKKDALDLTKGTVKKKGSKLLPGQRAGNFEFHNAEKLLPATDASGAAITYVEYDVNPKLAGADRDAERIVVGSDGRVWYTGTHYKSFSEIL